jgi:hypothetical protein
MVKSQCSRHARVTRAAAEWIINRKFSSAAARLFVTRERDGYTTTGILTNSATECALQADIERFSTLDFRQDVHPALSIPFTL